MSERVPASSDGGVPLWWVAGVALSMVFAAGYWGYYHALGSGRGPLSEYGAAKLALLNQSGTVSEEDIVALLEQPLFVRGGEEAFQRYCAECHEAKGQGKTGPNLTDAFWIHGGAPLDIYRTIYSGQIRKGMPAWGPTLGSAQVKQLAAFVVNVRDTNVPGRAPEGTRYVPLAPLPATDVPLAPPATDVPLAPLPATGPADADGSLPDRER